MNLRDIAHSAPRLPGVYLFKDSSGRALYIGKAASLRDRLANYFGPRVPAKTRYFLTRAASLETLLCNSDYEAFMLEYTLIKEHRPPFNIVFRDDKRYPYIKITAGDFPRIVLTRRVEDDTAGSAPPAPQVPASPTPAAGAKYFGPYVSGLNVHRILAMVHRFFKIRTCKRNIVDGKKSPPICLEYHIKRCDGPCEALVTRAAYGLQVARAERFLRGDYDALVGELKIGMREAAAHRTYELAALYRDQIAAIHELSEKQRAASASPRDIDAVSFAADADRGRICFYVFNVRKGHIIGNAGFVFPFAAAAVSEALGNFLAEYYKLRTDIPGEIAVKTEPEDFRSLERWLAERAGHPVRVWTPMKGYAKDLADLAEKNARANLYEKADVQTEETLDRLKDKLQLARRPVCIHGHDVANLGPSIVTGSRVVFLRGKPAKSFYRAYGLQDFDIKDDYAAMTELVRRSIRRAVESGPQGVPDLLLVDGGLGHVRAARKALRSSGVSDVRAESGMRNAKSEIQPRHSFEIVGLAKEEELIVLEDGKIIRLKRNDPALNLLQRIRDEAHRFSRRLMASRAKKKMLSRKS